MLSAGCSGYRLGSSLPPGLRSIHVPSFENKTGEPDIEATATSAAVLEFQKDGTLRVARAVEEADLVLKVTLVAVSMEPLRYSKDRVASPTQYRLLLVANAVLTERATGALRGEFRRLSGKTTFDSGGDLPGAKRQAIPLAAKDLAHKVVEAVAEAW